MPKSKSKAPKKSKVRQPLTLKQFIRKFNPDQHWDRNNDSLVDIACPRCGNRILFEIECTAFYSVTDSGIQDQTFDADWTVHSPIQCTSQDQQCGHIGFVKDFTVPGLDRYLSSLEPMPTKKEKAQRGGNRVGDRDEGADRR